MVKDGDIGRVVEYLR